MFQNVRIATNLRVNLEAPIGTRGVLFVWWGKKLARSYCVWLLARTQVLLLSDMEQCSGYFPVASVKHDDDAPCLRNGDPMERPTIENWLRPPFVFWSIRHAREILPCATVQCPQKQCLPLPQQLNPSLLELNLMLSPGTQCTLREHLENTRPRPHRLLQSSWLSSCAR